MPSLEYTECSFRIDQQLGQLYELMQATKKQGREDGGNDDGLL